MGWASGSRLLSSVIETIKTHVEDDDTRLAIYVELIDAFEDADCDTIDECMTIDPVFDSHLKENGYEHLFDEEDEE